jgi:hypothetical protein
VAELENGDVTWDLNCWIGLLPHLGDRAQAVLECGDVGVPYLIEALADDRRYVAAHVLLSYVSGQEFCVSDLTYNGLRVPFGVTDAEIPDQRPQIEAAWLTNQHPRDCFSQENAASVP